MLTGDLSVVSLKSCLRVLLTKQKKSLCTENCKANYLIKALNLLIKAKTNLMVHCNS